MIFFQRWLRIIELKNVFSFQQPHEIKSDLGELLISLVYNENLNRLSVTVIEARRLKVRRIIVNVHVLNSQ